MFYSWKLHPADQAVARVKTDDGVKQFTKLSLSRNQHILEQRVEISTFATDSLSLTYTALEQVLGRDTLLPTVQTAPRDSIPLPRP